MPDIKLDPAELPEILPDFLTAVRDLYTGQLSLMDRNDRPHYDKFIEGIVTAYRPANALEQQLAFSIAADYWRLNRTRTIEDGIFALCHPNPTGEFGSKPIAHQIAESKTSAFLVKQADFKFLSTYEMRIQRTINRNKAELRQLQHERRELEAQQPPIQPDPPPSRNGFVCSEPPAPQTGVQTEDPARVRAASNESSRPNGFAFSNPPAKRYS